MNGFRKRYQKEIAQAKKDQRSTAIILPTQKRGRPLMLGKLDALVQRYISAASNRGSVMTRSVVTYTAQEIAIEDTFGAKVFSEWVQTTLAKKNSKSVAIAG